MRDLSREIINLLYLSKKNANIKHIFIYLHIYMKHQLIESGWKEKIFIRTYFSKLLHISVPSQIKFKQRIRKKVKTI